MYRPDRYPRNWRELAIACKERANWKCEVCRVSQMAERISHRTGAVYSVFLHAAHVNLHDTGNPQPELQALCPTCHARMDYQHRMKEQQISHERLKHQLFLATRS